MDVVDDVLELLIASDRVIVEAFLPERPVLTEHLIGDMGRYAGPVADAIRQRSAASPGGPGSHRPSPRTEQNVDVVRHDTPGEQIEALVISCLQKRVHDRTRDTIIRKTHLPLRAATLGDYHKASHLAPSAYAKAMRGGPVGTRPVGPGPSRRPRASFHPPHLAPSNTLFTARFGLSISSAE